MHVVATAGHVDHGKSTLVRAVTGMEPDRWAEEHRRGMTIDLGYVWTTLPSGEQLAFVDVPGHRRFIGNMLAGIGPVTAVLFVVAADEGWARQSDEHLDAVDALGLRHGLLAVTRCDLADPAAAVEQSLGHIEQSSLGPVEHVVVSGLTGAGIDDLAKALDRLVANLPAPRGDGRVRLWVDRSFTARGSGTVVTGTLGAGSVTVGDELELRGRRVLVRGLHSLGEAQQRVTAVSRVALNLRGIARDEVGRGDVLLSPGAWRSTQVVDARIDTRSPLSATLLMHVGTAAIPVRVRPLGQELVRLSLAYPLPLEVGDRAILRDVSRESIMAGAVILDADPPALIRRGAAARRAADLASATGQPDVRAEITRRGAVRRRDLELLGLSIGDLGDVHDVNGWLITSDTWERWVTSASAEVDDWARRAPLDAGMPLEALRRQLDIPDRDLLSPVITQAGLLAIDGRATHPDRAVTLGASEQGIVAIERHLERAPFDAPERYQLDELGLGRRDLAAAEKAGRLLRISADIVLLPSAPETAVATLRTLPQPFTTSQARQALGTTRRVAIPLLEYLDAHGLTERVDQQTRRVLER